MLNPYGLSKLLGSDFGKRKNPEVLLQGSCQSKV